MIAEFPLHREIGFNFFWKNLAAQLFPQKSFILSWKCITPVNENSAGMLYVFSIALSNLKLKVMLRWTVIFLIIAIIAAIFGFGGVAAGAAGIAKVLFFIFLVLFVLSLISGRGRNVVD